MIIFVNVRKTSESEVSVLLRILTNYIQLIATTMSFTASLPTSLTDMFVPINSVGDTSNTFLSFECFITDYEATGPFPSVYLLKMFLSMFLPIILFAIVVLIWVIAYLIKKKFVKSMSRYLIISFISIVFLLHPKLAEQSLGFFRCVDIDEGVSKVRVSTDIECYSSEHIKWIFTLAIPILVIWVIGMPVIALIIMFKHVPKLEENKVKQYFFILYQGLKQKLFFWEFINSLRKVLILISFMLPGNIKILASL